MFPMTFTLHNAQQLGAVMAALGISTIAFDESTPIKAPTPKPTAAPAEASAAKTAPTEPTAAAAPAAAPEKKAEPSAPAQSHQNGSAAAATYDDVKAMILAVSKAKGRDGAVGLLKQFGAEKGPDLQAKPDQFGPFVEAAKALLS